ncbi:MAG: SDR family oxidoreductase [Armatimonadetes bacterium]|nr:SDR family oxidoreductase [Armatimonadota bacterium]
MGLLNGEVAFITGASKGIGRAIAEIFAREGALVAAAARSEGEIKELCRKIADAGGKAIGIKLDLRSEESVKNAVAMAQSELGPIDILVNNAGVLRLSKIVDTPTEVWDDLMDTNVRGVFLTCREVLPSMIGRKKGRIINIGSMAGRRGYEEQGAYCASKHALVGLSKVLSIETQKHGIRVHMLSPGGVLTELSRELRASRGESEDSTEWMTVDEIARAALYLCTQDGAAMTDELILRRFASEPWR